MLNYCCHSLIHIHRLLHNPTRREKGLAVRQVLNTTCCLVVSFVCKMSLTHTSHWKTNDHYCRVQRSRRSTLFRGSRESLEKNADPTVSQKRQWGVDGQAEVFRRTMTCTRWSRKTGFNADQRLTWICGDFTAIKRRKRRGSKIREVARKQRLLPSMI